MLVCAVVIPASQKASLCNALESRSIWRVCGCEGNADVIAAFVTAFAADGGLRVRGPAPGVRGRGCELLDAHSVTVESKPICSRKQDPLTTG